MDFDEITQNPTVTSQYLDEGHNTGVCDEDDTSPIDVSQPLFPYEANYLTSLSN